MDYTTAIEFFDTLSNDDQSKKIYTYFGLAIFYAQQLEQQAINMIAIYKMAKGDLKNAKDIDSLWDNYDFGKRTLGVLINEMKQLYNFSDKVVAELEALLKLRNYITHHYFRFHTDLFYSDSGKKRMIKDFLEFKDRVQVLDRQLYDYLKIYNDKMGITDAQLEDLMDRMKKDAEAKIIDDQHKTF